MKLHLKQDRFAFTLHFINILHISILKKISCLVSRLKTSIFLHSSCMTFKFFLDIVKSDSAFSQKPADKGMNFHKKREEGFKN